MKRFIYALLIAPAITLVLLVLKVIGVAAIPWWVVGAPLWVVPWVFVVLLVLTLWIVDWLWR